MPRLIDSTARLASLMRALAPYASECLLARGGLIALMLLAWRQRVWLVARVRRMLAALFAFGADSGAPR